MYFDGNQVKGGAQWCYKMLLVKRNRPKSDSLWKKDISKSKFCCVNMLMPGI